MSADVVATEPDTEMSELIAMLLEHKVGALPVILPGTRQIVGIVSYIDVLQAVRDALEVE
jgi:CBS-domain-containing membrane protein